MNLNLELNKILKFCSVVRQGFGHKKTAQLGPWYVTGGLRKPAGRQCGFRHHLALSSIVRLFHSVKVEFRGLLPLAYCLHRARTGSRPPPVAALALALTLPGNGGSAARRTGYPAGRAGGPRAPNPARGTPPGAGTPAPEPSAPEGGTRGRPAAALSSPQEPRRRRGKGKRNRAPRRPGQTPQRRPGAGGQQGPPTPTRRRATRPGEGGGDEPGGPSGRRQGARRPRSPRKSAGAATAHHATGAGRIPMEPPSSLGGKGCTGQGGPATERGPGEPPE